MKRRLLLASLIAAAAIVSCTEDPDDGELFGGDENVPAVSVDCDFYLRYSTESEVAVNVFAEPGASYDLIIPDDAKSWVTSLSASSSNSSGLVTLALSENNTAKDRTARISFQYGKTKSVSVTVNQSAKPIEEYYSSWGLKGDFSGSVRHDRPYNWYVDQGSTGQYSDENCGPSCAVMVSRWFSLKSAETVEQARRQFHPAGGWWYTEDVLKYLTGKGIPVSTALFENVSSIKNVLDGGNIAILCLDMYPISSAVDDFSKLGKFYRTGSSGWGHFIVIKGYVQTGTALYLEAYDPFSFGRTNLDRTLKGADRYYSADEIFRSASGWETRIIVIPPKG